MHIDLIKIMGGLETVSTRKKGGVKSKEYLFAPFLPLQKNYVVEKKLVEKKKITGREGAIVFFPTRT